MNSPEQRAENLWLALSAGLGLDDRDHQIAVIAEAIREAQDARLEEAARFFETGGDQEWSVYPKEIARNVRSLKFGVDITLERLPAAS